MRDLNQNENNRNHNEIYGITIKNEQNKTCNSLDLGVSAKGEGIMNE